MYASKEEFRQYLFSPYRKHMSFQQYLLRQQEKEPDLNRPAHVLIKEEAANQPAQVESAQA